MKREKKNYKKSYGCCFKLLFCPNDGSGSFHDTLHIRSSNSWGYFPPIPLFQTIGFLLCLKKVSFALFLFNFQKTREAFETPRFPNQASPFCTRSGAANTSFFHKHAHHAATIFLLLLPCGLHVQGETPPIYTPLHNSILHRSIQFSSLYPFFQRLFHIITRSPLSSLLFPPLYSIPTSVAFNSSLRFSS